MTLQSDFREVTDRIISARHDLCQVEVDRLAAKRRADLAAEELDAARRAMMARSDAGTNDAQRRAYAERETIRERDHADRQADELLATEAGVIRRSAELRMAEDERRYLELVARLVVAGVGDADGLDEAAVAENGNGERYTLADANRDMF